jgi:O-antigen ligase
MIYAIYVMGATHALGGFLIGAAIFLPLITALAWGMSEGDLKVSEFAKKHRRFPFIAGIFGIVLVVFVPDERSMLLIASSQVGEKIVNSDTVKSVLDPSTDLLKSWIQLETKKIKKELDKDK